MRRMEERMPFRRSATLLPHLLPIPHLDEDRISCDSDAAELPENGLRSHYHQSDQERQTFEHFCGHFDHVLVVSESLSVVRSIKETVIICIRRVVLQTERRKYLFQMLVILLLVSVQQGLFDLWQSVGHFFRLCLKERLFFGIGGPVVRVLQYFGKKKTE